MKKIILILVGFAVVFAAIRFTRPKENPAPAPDQVPDETGTRQQIDVIAENLNIPWDVDFLPDGEILITERPGDLLVIGEGRQVIKISGVKHTGEGGLLGLAVHPNFSDNHWIYLYLTSEVSRQITNRVERYKLSGNEATERKVIIEGIKGS